MLGKVQKITYSSFTKASIFETPLIFTVPLTAATVLFLKVLVERNLKALCYYRTPLKNFSVNILKKRITYLGIAKDDVGCNCSFQKMFSSVWG